MLVDNETDERTPPWHSAGFLNSCFTRHGGDLFEVIEYKKRSPKAPFLFGAGVHNGTRLFLIIVNWY